MNRRTVATLTLLGVLALSGCFGPSQIPEEDLQGAATYDWDTNATTTFNLSRSSYSTVLAVTNRTSVSVYQQDALGTNTPVQLRALKFQFENGTVVNATEANLSAKVTQDRTVIRLPAENGTVAYTASRIGKHFSSPVYLTGSHEVVLPPNTRVGVPVLSNVNPGGYETRFTDDDRMVLRWANLSSGSVSVQYYLQRDLLLFGGLFVIGIVLAVGGTIYYLRQIRQLEAKRKELGVDIDYDDDDPRDEGPPPGMG